MSTASGPHCGAPKPTPSSRQFKFLLNRPAPGKPIADPCDPQLERGPPDLIGYGGLDDSFQSDILATFEFWTASTLSPVLNPTTSATLFSTTEVTSTSPSSLRASSRPASFVELISGAGNCPRMIVGSEASGMKTDTFTRRNPAAGNKLRESPIGSFPFDGRAY